MKPDEYAAAKERAGEKLALLIKEAKLRRLDFNETPPGSVTVELRRLQASGLAAERVVDHLAEYFAAEGYVAETKHPLIPTTEFASRAKAMQDVLAPHILPGAAGLEARRATLAAAVGYASFSPDYKLPDWTDDNQSILDDLNAAREARERDPGLEGTVRFTEESARAVTDAFGAAHQAMLDMVRTLDPVLAPRPDGREAESPDSMRGFRRDIAKRRAEIGGIRQALDRLDVPAVPRDAPSPEARPEPEAASLRPHLLGKRKREAEEEVAGEPPAKRQRASYEERPRSAVGRGL